MQLVHTPHPTAITTSLSATVNKCYRPSPTIGASATDNWPEHSCAPPPTLQQPANPVSEPWTHSMAPTLRTCKHSYCSAKSPSTHTCNSTQQMPPKSFSPSAI